jgi:hypothetical protein
MPKISMFSMTTIGEMEWGKENQRKKIKDMSEEHLYRACIQMQKYLHDHYDDEDEVNDWAIENGYDNGVISTENTFKKLATKMFPLMKYYHDKKFYLND